MITLARIINAFRDAEQFDFPVDARSLLWHVLIIPQYALAIFSLWTYGVIAKNRFWTFSILLIDLILAWIAFEWFLGFFRNGRG